VGKKQGAIIGVHDAIRSRARAARAQPRLCIGQGNAARYASGRIRLVECFYLCLVFLVAFSDDSHAETRKSKQTVRYLFELWSGVVHLIVRIRTHVTSLKLKLNRRCVCSSLDHLMRRLLHSISFNFLILIRLNEKRSHRSLKTGRRPFKSKNRKLCKSFRNLTIRSCAAVVSECQRVLQLHLAKVGVVGSAELSSQVVVRKLNRSCGL
jgi:hypothetical protein